MKSKITAATARCLSILVAMALALGVVSEVPADVVELKVMTYNIWVGGNPLAKTAEVILASGADVIGLQEHGGSAAALAADLGFYYHEIDSGDNAILSRYPITTTFGYGAGIALPGGGEAYVFDVHLTAYPYQPYDIRDGLVSTEEGAIAGAEAARAWVQSPLADLGPYLAAGAPVFFTGDFNEPSHLDWTQEAADAGLHPFKVNWPTSNAIYDAGLFDSFREFRPDEVADPAYTWSPGAPFPNVDPNDVHDRIDMVYYGGPGVVVTDSQVVGELAANADIVVANYPSDHRAVVSTFNVPQWNAVDLFEFGFGTNLISNPDAEANPPGVPYGEDLGVFAWIDTSGFITAQQYNGWAVDDPSTGGVYPGPEFGDLYFYGGAGLGATTEQISQRIDVTDGAGPIDAGTSDYDLSGWFGGWADQDDRASLIARFLNASDVELGSVTLGDFFAADRGNVSSLLFDEMVGDVPVGTRTIEVVLQFDGTYGSGDGSADNLALILISGELIWDGAGNANWGEFYASPPDPPNSHWRDEGGNPVTYYPDAGTPAVVNANTVTVEANHEAYSLSVGSEATVAIADGMRLTLTKNVDAAGSLTIGHNAALVAEGGAVGNLNLGGTSAVDVSSSLEVTVLSDEGVAATLVKQGAGTVSLNNATGAGVTVLPGTTFRIEEGVLSSAGVKPLGEATTVELAGGKLSVQGLLTAVPGPADNLVAYWSFDDGPGAAILTDSTGLNPGTLTGLDPGNDWVTGHTGNVGDYALRFDGIDDFVSVGATAGLQVANDVSISAWMDVETFVDWAAVAGWVYDTGTVESGYVMGVMADGSAYWAVGPAAAGWINYQTASGQQTDAWYHVVGTYESATGLQKLYVNGQQITEATLLGGPIDWDPLEDTDGFEIGRYHDDNDNIFFNGLIDDVYVYSDVLSPTEIAAMSGNANLDMQHTNVVVSASSVLEVKHDDMAVLGDLTMVGGILTTTGSPTGIRFGGTIIDPGASLVGFDPQVRTDFGEIDANWADVTIVKAGPSHWALDAAPLQMDTVNARWEVREGTLEVTGTAALAGCPVDLTGGTLMITGEMIGSQPGLLFGVLPGALNTTDPNPGGSVTINLAETEDPSIPEYTTHVLSGEFYDADGHVNFRENIDDNAWLKIDETVVLEDYGYDIPTATGDLKLTAGWHRFELRLGNGGGPGGQFAGLGFGFDPAGGSDFLHPEDPGDGSLFRIPNRGPIDAPSLPLLVHADSTLAVMTDSTATIGSLTLLAGNLATSGGQSVSFTGTTVEPGATAVGFAPETPTYPNTITADGVTELTISKLGASDLILNATNVGLDNTTFDVQQGRLIAVHNPNPLDSAAISINGGEVVLAGATPQTDIAYDGEFAVVSDGILTAGTGGVGEDGPLTVTLGGVYPVTLADSAVLTLRSTGNYTLDVAGSLDGPQGGVSVTEGTVNLIGGGSPGSVKVLGGTLNVDATLSPTSLDVSGGVLNANVDLQVQDANISDGVANTGGNRIVASHRITFGSTPFTISEGDTFSAEGADLGNDAVDRLITLSGGTLGTGASSLPSDLVSYWSFDDGPGSAAVADSAGGNDGTLTNMDVNTAWTIGHTPRGDDYALNFDGLNDYVSVGLASSLQVADSVTLAAWVNVTEYTYYAAIAGWLHDTGSIDESGYALGTYQDGWFYWGVNPEAQGGEFPYLWSQAGNPTSTWFHLVGTYDADTGLQTLYINGDTDNPYVAQLAGGPINWNKLGTDGFEIGRYHDDDETYPFNGAVDDLMVYERALDADEIVALYNYTPDPSEALVLPKTHLSVTADSTLAISSLGDAIIGDLTVADGVNFVVDHAGGLSVQNLNLGNGALLGKYNDPPAGDQVGIPCNLYVRGQANVGNSPGTATIFGSLELDEVDATLNIDIEGEAHDKIATDGSAFSLADIFVGGSLAVTGLGPMKDGGNATWGDKRLTILEIVQELYEGGGILGEFGEEEGTTIPLSYGVAGTLPNEGDYLGAGLWFGNATDDPAGENGIYYEFQTVGIGVFQAAPGDTDGNRKVEGQDILNILQAGLFGDGVTPEANWGNGDFNSDSKISGEDILALLGTGLFGDGTYPDSAAAAAGADVKLVVTGDGLVIDTGGATVTGFVLSSESGILTGDDANNLGLFQEDTDAAISGTFAMSLGGEHALGDVLGNTDVDLGGDLSLAYTIAGVPGVFTASIVVPEPGMIVMLLSGLVGLLIWRRRK